MNKTILGAALAFTSAVAVTATIGVASPAGARPQVPGRGQGLSLAQARDAAAAGPTGDCADSGVHCKPNLSGSCTGNTSQTTPPANIRVYDPTYTGVATHIRIVPFEQYVEEVLPNEWAATFDGDSLKAGAVAVTSYAWYWATHFGGYVGTDSTNTSNCFDVTTDDNFQVYKAGSAQANSTAKVQQVFPNAIRVNGSVLEASYLADLNPDYDPKSQDPVLDTCGQDADGTTLSQDGSQACNEANTAYKWPVILKLYYGPNIQLATAQQLRTQHDFQYLHRSTPAVFTNGVWTISDGYPTTISFGGKGEIPVVNTSGDGFARVGVFNPATSYWYLGSPTGGVLSKFRFGVTGDVPAAAQYQGLTSPTQVAIFRPSSGTWYFASSTGSVSSKVAYGSKGDVPIPADYNGDGKAEVAVYRPSSSRFYVYGSAAVPYGTKGDVAIPADYNGDGKSEVAVYRPSTSTFYIYGRAAIPYGTKGDIPVTGDFTGDGKADVAVYRPSTHTLYVYGQAAMVLPVAGTPIGAAPYHQ